MNRVMITGGPGSGKSTLARKLGKCTGIPVHHIDKIALLPGWMERPKSETAKLMHGIQVRNKWIIDGNYSMSIQHREERSDMIVFIDIPVFVRLFRIMKRIVENRGHVRPDMAEGCPETFHFDFIKWTWNTRKSIRESGLARLERHKATKQCVLIRSNRDIEEFLGKLQYSTR